MNAIERRFLKVVLKKTLVSLEKYKNLPDEGAFLKPMNLNIEIPISKIRTNGVNFIQKIITNYVKLL